VTDSGSEISYDPDKRPGLANLLELGAGCSDHTIEQLINAHTSFGALKATVADAAIAVLEPIQRRYAELDPGDVAGVFAEGSDRARAVAAPTLAAAQNAIGLGT
jgi:tryptophanyl-tRNA synthetase